MSLDHTKRPVKQLKFAIPLIVLAAFFVACMAAIVKDRSSHITAEALVFWRNLVSLILLIPFLFLSKPKEPLITKLKTTQWRLHFFRGITSFLAVYLYFYSLQFLDLTDATLLFNTIPIFIPLVAFVWQRIKIYHSLWWAIGVSFLGIVIVLEPGTRIFHFASLLALLSGIVGAISLVSLRLGHYSEPPIRMLFYLFVICTICPFLITLFSWKESWSLSSNDFIFIALLGIFGFLYQLTMTAATKFAPIRLISPFLYAAVLFTMMIDKIVWKISFSLFSLVGFFLVIAGAFLMLILYPKEDLHIKSK